MENTYHFKIVEFNGVKALCVMTIVEGVSGTVCTYIPVKTIQTAIARYNKEVSISQNKREQEGHGSNR